MSERFFIGVDTSNYTTSFAVCNEDGEVLVNEKRLLTVAEGQRGLRQSDALFAHTVNLPELCGVLRGYRPSAIGYSAYPRDEEGSYMPCFLAGKSAATVAAAMCGCAAYPFSHQAGHIRAALYAAGAEQIMDAPFLAFHVSGGTTELLLCEPCGGDRRWNINKIGETLDLNAGQLIDRTGVLLGLGFPCGPALEELMGDTRPPVKPRISVRGLDCNLSGCENQVKKLLDSGAAHEEIAAYAVEFVLATVSAMTGNALERYPGLPVLYAGGVMSNRRVQKVLKKRFDGYFAAPQFSSDNAAGIALLTRERWMKEQ